VHKHNDFGFVFTVETDKEIPNNLTESFLQRMSNIDENLLAYYTNIEFIESKNFLLFCEKEPIGYAKLFEDKEYSLLTEIFIKEEFRELSLGTFLLNCIREYVQTIQSSLRTVTLPSDRVAKNFYEASGITARMLLMEEKRDHNRYRP
jgi:hypothetical protein|tara:strand:+ start:161 stop:604 length:444 start_codon:yes stop_codon:yes gene_type:complete